MIRPPVIAVSQRVDRVHARSENRDALDQRLADWLLELGGLPVPVPNALGAELPRWLAALCPVAVVLSGGNDIGDSKERDYTEAQLIEYASRVGLPLLGICRGMQMLAHYAGGCVLVPVADHAGKRHALLGAAARIGTLPAEVDSYHNLGLITCPPSYEVLATAADGSIEAMRHGVRHWEGWMWHPEREAPFGELELLRARKLLIDECDK